MGTDRFRWYRLGISFLSSSLKTMESVNDL